MPCAAPNLRTRRSGSRRTPLNSPATQTRARANALNRAYREVRVIGRARPAAPWTTGTSTKSRSTHRIDSDCANGCGSSIRSNRSCGTRSPRCRTRPSSRSRRPSRPRRRIGSSSKSSRSSRSSPASSSSSSRSCSRNATTGSPGSRRSARSTWSCRAPTPSSRTATPAWRL